MSETEIEKEHKLIQKVFSTPDGKELLIRLSDQYVWAKQMHPDPHVMYSRLGVQELIIHFLVIMGGKA